MAVSISEFSKIDLHLEASVFESQALSRADKGMTIIVLAKVVGYLYIWCCLGHEVTGKTQEMISVLIHGDY